MAKDEKQAPSSKKSDGITKSEESNYPSTLKFGVKESESFIKESVKIKVINFLFIE